MHPEIPAILTTLIYSHTLSFWPMLLPDSMELQICVPYNSRSNMACWALFNERGHVELKRKTLQPVHLNDPYLDLEGDHIKFLFQDIHSQQNITFASVFSFFFFFFLACLHTC